MTEERRNSAQLRRNFSRKPVSTSCRPGLPLSTAQTASTVRLLRLPHVTSSHAHASIHCPLDTCRRPLIQAQSFGGSRQASHYTPTWTWPRRARQRPDESNRHVALVASRPEGKGTGVRLASGNRAGAPTGATPAAARRPTLPGSGLPLPSRRRTATPVPRRPARRPVAVTNLALYTRPVAGCEPAVGSSPETNTAGKMLVPGGTPS